MSGEKVAQVDLNEEAKHELNRIIKNNRQNALVLAGLSNLLGRQQSLQEDIKYYLDSSSISEGFRRKLEEFQTLAAQFTIKFSELRILLDKLEQQRNSSNPILARNEASRLQKAIKILTQELEQLAAELKGQLQGVEQSIAAEMQVEEYRNKQAVRHELTGLLEELNMRLHPATSLNFQSVAERANALVTRIEELCKRQDSVSSIEVQECRKQLDKISQEAEENEREAQKQWTIFTKLNDAFQGAGFYLDTPVRMPQQDVPIKARHVIAEEELRASVNTMVYRSGQVNLEMWGASGEETVVLGRDQHCNLNLERIVSQALDCGLVIKSVTWKDPDNPNGWTAMIIPGVEDEAMDDEETHSHSQSKKKELHQQAILPK